MFKIICALSLNHTIGREGKLPWRLSSDLQHFKKSTLGHRIIMGRKTFDEIGGPLPKRTNIMISRASPTMPDVHPLPSNDTLQDWQNLSETTYIAGWAEIYSLFMPYCKAMSLTWVLAEVDGDKHFPLPDMHDWHLQHFVYHQKDEKNEFNHVICDYVRKSDTKVFTSIDALV